MDFNFYVLFNQEKPEELTNNSLDLERAGVETTESAWLAKPAFKTFQLIYIYTDCRDNFRFESLVLVEVFICLS